MVFIITLSKFLVKKSNPLVICGWKHGREIVMYNGKLEYECTYINDKPNGLYREWYNNGQLMCECTYINDKHNGLYRLWHENGKLLEEYTYVDDKRNGSYRKWYMDGQLMYECTYVNGTAIR